MNNQPKQGRVLGTAQSGIHAAKRLLPLSLPRVWLAESLFTGRYHGLITDEDFATLFPPKILIEMCESSAAFRQLLMQNTCRINLEGCSVGYSLTLIKMAFEEKLTSLHAVESIHMDRWATFADESRLWAALLRTHWWQSNFGYSPAEQLTLTMLVSAVRYRIFTFQAVLKMLGGVDEVVRRKLVQTRNDFAPQIRRDYALEEPKNFQELLQALLSVFALDEIYLRVITPLANKFQWDAERFLRDEIPTNPDLRPLPEEIKKP